MLFQRKPLVVDPALAAVLGLREAIIVQQAHYWLGKSKRCQDRKRWIYNTYADWRRQFPFLSESQVRSAILFLEKPFTPSDPDDQRPARGPVILSRQDLNKFASDRTKWYSLDYRELQRISFLADELVRSIEDADSGLPPSPDEDDPFFTGLLMPVVEVAPAPTPHSAPPEPAPNPSYDDLYRELRGQHQAEFSTLMYSFLGGELQGAGLDNWVDELVTHARHGRRVTAEQVRQAVDKARSAWKGTKDGGRTMPRTGAWIINALKEIMQEDLTPPPPLREKFDPQVQRVAASRKRTSPLDALARAKEQAQTTLHTRSPVGT